MDHKQEALTKTIAILLSVTPETTLGSLLNACLAAKVKPETTGMTALEMAQECIEVGYYSMTTWINDVIVMDDYVTYEEDEAFFRCLETPDMFSDFILEELERINYSENMNLQDLQAALTTAIAILLSVTSDTPLGQLFKLCLAAQVTENTAGRNPLDMARGLIENGSEDMYNWIFEVIKADNYISWEEKEILNNLRSSEMFLSFIKQELKTINI